MIKIPDWMDIEEQNVGADGGRYDISSVVFNARNLKPFDLELRGMNINYSLTNGKILDFLTHVKAMEAVDLSHPIILDTEGWLIDGRHRLAKAIHLGHSTIKAVQFEKNPPKSGE